MTGHDAHPVTHAARSPFAISGLDCVAAGNLHAALPSPGIKSDRQLSGDPHEW